VDALKGGSDYAEMAQLALDQGSPGEAVAILNKAFAANAFTDAADKNRNTHLLESAKKAAAADEPTLPKSEADAANSPNGDRFIGAGKGYFGYGDYAKASKDLQAGLDKGTAKDATDARLLLGIAQLKSGDKDGAVKSFNAVKGDPLEERLAALWVLHSRSAG
jgi:TolA-binding protein